MDAQEKHRAPKRITITVPCDLADRVQGEAAKDRRRYGPMIVKLAEEGLRARAEREGGKDRA